MKNNTKTHTDFEAVESPFPDSPFVVMKFGGRSVSTEENWGRIAALLQARLDSGITPVVVSNSPYSFILGLMSVFSCFGTGNRRFQTVCMACRRALERVPGIDMQVS